MVAKVRVVVLLISMCMPLVALAQSSGSAARSLKNPSLRDAANGSIVMLSEEESGVSGYINARYAYVHPDCPGGAQVVHYSGPAFNINDRTVLHEERRKCSDNTYEDSGDED